MVRKSARIFSLVLILALLLAACAGGNNAVEETGAVPGTGDTTPEVTEAAGGEMDATATEDTAAEPTAEATTEATVEATATTEGGDAGAGGETGGDVGTGPVFTGEQIGGTVSVLAIWGGEELDNFNAMIAPFQEATGITVEVETTRDLGAVLNTRIQGGNPPDVAGLPNPGQLIELANAGSLIPLDDVLDMESMGQVYDEGFLNLAMSDGQTYGIFTKAAVKSLVWYNPKVFEANGWTVPTTWDELNTLEDQMAATGVTPWCVGIEGGAGSGWPGTDWVEDIMLRTAGPETYDQWWQHQIPWTDPAVVNAFETWGTIVADPNMAYGGPQNVVVSNFGEAFVPMFEEEPGCYMHRQASFITTFFQEQFPELVAGEDYNFFVFPPIDDQFGNPLLVAGDLFGMLNDTPQARALIQYMVTAEAQTIWAERGGFLSANRAVDPASYPDTITQQIGELIAGADAVRFDASDLMPQAVNSAFSTAVLQYVADPGQLQTLLEQVEGVAAESYQPAGQ